MRLIIVREIDTGDVTDPVLIVKIKSEIEVEKFKAADASLKAQIEHSAETAVDDLIRELGQDDFAEGRYDDPEVYGFDTAADFITNTGRDAVVWKDDLVVLGTDNETEVVIPLDEFKVKVLVSLRDTARWVNHRRFGEIISRWSFSFEVLRSDQTD